MGFSGTTTKGTADAAGLITLPADSFGGGPTTPMLPGTWDSSTEGKEENP
jgi:PPE-repeat protein